MRLHLKAVWGIAVLAGAVFACETTRNPGGIQRDLTPPVITLTNAAGDTQQIAEGLRFTVSAVDNLGLKTIELFYTGGHVGQEDTVFTSTVTDFTLQKTVTFPAGSGAGGLVQIVGRAADGAANTASDTLFIFLSNVSALRVILLAPAQGAVASSGRGIPVDVTAIQNEGIRKIGFLVSPASAVSNPTTPPNDSLTFTIPYADSVRYVDTLIVNAVSGTFNVVGFAEDSSGRRGTSNVVTVSILSAANDTVPPFVEHTIASRVEVNDSVTVHATDPSGISWMGIRIQRASDGAVLRFDTVNVTSNPPLTDVTRKFSLNLGTLIPQDSTPYSIIVRGYACDVAAARNCAFSQTSTVIQGSQSGGGPFLAPGTDTVVVVSGVTTPFPRRPFPTQIADAIFNANRNELYLTNTTNDLVEVFQVANTTFVAGGIPKAGAQPWGIALWPRDTLGNYGDSIVVANSGGTQLAVMDAVTRLPRWRQDLPNFLIQTYKVTQVGGGLQEVITTFDLSDRPQYVAAVCRPTTGGGAPCHPDSIFALYSTTPTPSQPAPFTSKGTLRMEKLVNTTDTSRLYGKFFWEIASTSFTTGTDTLRIELHRGPPYNQRKVVLSACAGVIVNMSRMGLGDRTFARNSGNFTHAFFGEGGNVQADFARVMAYDARDALLHGSSTFTSCNTHPSGATTDAGDNDVDLGMSPGVDVSDFISNTATKVRAIATNFNGLTNAVRADSIYYLGEDLRLKATSIAPEDELVVGMDMNYFHDFAPTGQCNPNCGGSGSTDNRVIFVARPDGTIAVFDTYFGYFVRAIAVRDPIIGPLRVARDATGQLLFGVTATGVVMVRIPPISNPGPTPPQAGTP
ncbi:MAG TPA: hypothetical protein VNI61_00605 [Gemmatimonadales bacterium]|nr:hypothetical protein [Gemmatimonadales bacterium]